MVYIPCPIVAELLYLDPLPIFQISVMSSKGLEFLHEVLPRCVWDKSHSSNDVHITLTFAQSLDGKIAGVGGKQLILSGKESMLMTHW